MAATLVIMLCFFFSTVLIPNTRAKIIEFDGYWKERQAKAVEHINAAYHPRPEDVTHHFNQHVESYVTEMGYNNTRRVLKGRKARNKGPCEATNPIDKCWRCDPNWAKNRFRLADCAIGFGRGTTGGKGGPIYVVTDCSDDDVVNPKPGTLRHAVIQTGPLWIIFARSMVITLKQELIMTSNKTIDGRGANVHIAYGAQITIQFIHNVIIHNVHIHDIGEASGSMIRDSVTHFGQRGKSDGDGVSLFGASNIWLDHLSIYRCFDGLIDAIQTSTAVTVSNSHFTQHNEVMLFGAHDSYKDDQKMQITLAFNHFGKALVQRMPRVRWGFVHVVNNAYTHWLMYAIGGSSQPTIISQGNRYYAPINQASKQVTKREYATEAQWKNWAWISEGDVMLNGAFFVPSGNPAAAKKFSSEFMIKAYAGAMVPQLTRHAGTLNCLIGKPC